MNRSAFITPFDVEYSNRPSFTGKPFFLETENLSDKEKMICEDLKNTAE
jgi:hypothetical protein